MGGQGVLGWGLLPHWERLTQKSQRTKTPDTGLNAVWCATGVFDMNLTVRTYNLQHYPFWNNLSRASW